MSKRRPNASDDVGGAGMLIFRKGKILSSCFMVRMRVAAITAATSRRPTMRCTARRGAAAGRGAQPAVWADEPSDGGRHRLVAACFPRAQLAGATLVLGFKKHPILQSDWQYIDLKKQ